VYAHNTNELVVGNREYACTVLSIEQPVMGTMGPTTELSIEQSAMGTKRAPPYEAQFIYYVYILNVDQPVMNQREQP
jgi:hypothetical protein